MSEKFGLDWKDYDCKRMDKFIKIIVWEQKKNGQHDKTKQKFRPKM